MHLYMFMQDSHVSLLRNPGLRGKMKGSLKTDLTKTCNTLLVTVQVCSITWTGFLCPFFKIAFCKRNECSPTNSSDLKGTPCIFYMHLLSTVTFLLNWALGFQSLECRNEMLSFAFSWRCGPCQKCNYAQVH